MTQKNENKNEIKKVVYEKVSYFSIVWGQFKKNKIAMFCLYCILLLFLMATYAPFISLDKPFYYKVNKVTINEKNVENVPKSLKEVIVKPELASQPEGLKLPSESKENWVKIKDLEVYKTVYNNVPYKYEDNKLYIDNNKKFDMVFMGDLEEAEFKEQSTKYPFFSYLFDRNFFENGVDIFFNILMFALPLYLLVMFVSKMILENNGLKFEFYAIKIVILLIVAQLFFFTMFQIFKTRKPYRDYKSEISFVKESKGNVSYSFPLLKYSYRETDIGSANPKEPSFKHFLGTDKEGRDVFVRMVYGTRIAITVGIVAVSIYVLLGIIIGSLAGYYGGWVDMIVSRVIEIMMCFPTFFLILTLAAIIEDRSIFHVMIIIGVTRWTGIARLVRGEVLRQKNMDYSQAAIAMGLGQIKIIFNHVLPNALAPVLVSASFGVAAAILTESGLAFLGIGDASAASWGELLNVGRTEQKLWLILTPGLAIFFVVSIFNLVGEALRDALDPKLRQ